MKLIMTAILFLTTELLYGQSFEGTLVYKADFEFHISEKMAQMGITEEMMKEKIKNDGSWSDSIKTSYKQGEYITYTNSIPQSWSVYKQKDNKLYSFQNGEASDICTVTDASIDLEFQMTGNKPTIEKLDTLVELNGMKCEVVRVRWQAGIYDYYYNNSFLNVNYKLFEKHVYDGWADFLKISNSLPVKIVKSVNSLTTVTLTLVRHSQQTIDPKLFTIPKLVTDKDLNIFKTGNRE
ncbi:MAG TPA: hypothetical protein VEC36_11185, partial [Patescibacteria group bacterium]|nr:hypothetical protein [Patescibacteria group bacterium]